MVAGLRDQLARVASLVVGRPRPRLAVLEWTDPPYSPGHWIPDLIAAAGALSVLGTPGGRSVQIGWAELAAAQPDLIVVAPCGYGLDDARRLAGDLVSAGALPAGVPCGPPTPTPPSFAPAHAWSTGWRPWPRSPTPVRSPAARTAGVGGPGRLTRATQKAESGAEIALRDAKGSEKGRFTRGSPGCSRPAPRPATAGWAPGRRAGAAGLPRLGVGRLLVLGGVGVRGVAVVHLGHGPQPHLGGHVDQQPEVDAVAGGEGKSLQQGAPSAVLTRQGLGEAEQVGEEAGQEGTGHQFGHPATLTGPAFEVPPVAALDEVHRGVAEQRGHQAGDEAEVEAGDVGVTPDHHVAPGGGEGLPQRLALARGRSALGEDGPGAHHPGAGPTGFRRRGVRRAVVDHHHLVDQSVALDQAVDDEGDDRPDRGRLVASRQADRDGGVALAGHQLVDGEIGDRGDGHGASSCEEGRGVLSWLALDHREC